ncbi:MAG: protease SohB, partial [Gammaproteobacteria bacterium]|nr:protease SohB [Gammaproteobacteria bacterium]
MMEFLASYGLFLLKVATVVVAVVIVIGVAAAAGRKAAHEGLEVESINKKYKSQARTLRDAVTPK